MMIEVKNPATGEIIATVEINTEKEVVEKIEIGNKAFEEWRMVDAHSRAILLKKWSRKIEDNKNEVAKIITSESGKPLKEALAEVNYARSYIDWYAEEATRIYGRTIPSNTSDKKIIVSKQPVGLVVGISPWNFPAAMITRKVAPALAAGCTFIAKPAAETPLTTIKLIELAHEVGISKEVLQYTNGRGSVLGKIFTENNDVKKITFTGSTEVGKTIFSNSSGNMKHLSMELGGHAPIIIHKDICVEDAVEQTIHGKFRNAGQTCISINRILVHEDIAEEFTEKLTEKMKALKVGNGLNEDTDVGPVINKKSFEKIVDQINDAKEKGAKVILGDEFKSSDEKDYYFINPTLLTEVTGEMDIMTEETFGPVLPLTTYENLNEALNIANNTPAGLAAYFATNDYRVASYLHDNLDFGVIGWNDGAPSAAHAPFGGMKESGLGREGGTEGIELFLETKYLSIGKTNYVN